MKCRVCGTEFLRRRNQASKVFCSDRCRRSTYVKRVLVIKVMVPCRTCGKEFEPRFGKKFCTDACRKKHNYKRREGKNTLPPRLKVPPPQSRIWEGYGPVP